MHADTCVSPLSAMLATLPYTNRQLSYAIEYSGLVSWAIKTGWVRVVVNPYPALSYFT